MVGAEYGKDADLMPLLEVEELRTWFDTDRGVVRAVDGVSLTLESGEVLGIVGESGSGKSVFCRSVMGLFAHHRAVLSSGSVRLDGSPVLGLRAPELRSLWGRRVAIIFQDSMSALNPVVPIGRQITEVLRRHLAMSRKAARTEAIELLTAVGIPDPVGRLRQFPHQLSGGMRQRVTIAVALAGRPDLLIADEPTTALDVTVQAQILGLLQRLQRERGMAIIFVTHDLGVAASIADRVAVMYAGKVVELAPTGELLGQIRMPYTEALFRSSPRLELHSHTRLAAIPGRPPDLTNVPPGCRFHPRCSYTQEKCLGQEPSLEGEALHLYACWYPVERVGSTTRSAATSDSAAGQDERQH